MGGEPETRLFRGLLLYLQNFFVYAWLQLQCSRAHTVLNSALMNTAIPEIQTNAIVWGCVSPPL